MPHVIVVSGGAVIDAVGSLPADVLVIAADSGAESALRLGLPLHVLVGDLDSVDPSVVEQADEVIRHPTDKDATDLELALEVAIVRGATAITVLSGGICERVDHFLAECALVAACTAVPIELRIGRSRAYPIHAGRSLELQGTPGGVVSLLGAARGVTTNGLRWTLNNAELLPGSSRGVSNEFVETVAHVSVGEGTVLVVGESYTGKIV